MEQNISVCLWHRDNYNKLAAYLDGDTDAVNLLKEIQYFCQETRSGTVVDGVRWIYNRAIDWITNIFPYWSERKFWRKLKKLREKELVFVSRLWQTSWTQTNHYTTNNSMIKKVIIGSISGSLESDNDGIVGDDQTGSLDYINNKVMDNKETTAKRTEQKLFNEEVGIKIFSKEETSERKTPGGHSNKGREKQDPNQEPEQKEKQEFSRAAIAKPKSEQDNGQEIDPEIKEKLANLRMSSSDARVLAAIGKYHKSQVLAALEAIFWKREAIQDAIAYFLAIVPKQEITQLGIVAPEIGAEMRTRYEQISQEMQTPEYKANWKDLKKRLPWRKK